MTLTRKKNKNNKKIKTRKQRGGSPFIRFLDDVLDITLVSTINIIPISEDIVNFFNDKVNLFNSDVKNKDNNINWKITPNSTLYEVYDVNPNAYDIAPDVKTKFKIFRLMVHPDKNNNTEVSKDTFVALSKIKEIFVTSRAKLRYNEILEQDRLKQEEAERQRLEQERIRAEEERKEELKKRVDETKAKNDKRLEEKRLQREQFEKDRLERERLEKERLEKELSSYNFDNTTKPKKIIGKPIVIEGLSIYKIVNNSNIKSVFNPQFGLKGGKKTYNKRNRLKKTKKTKR